MEELNPYAPPKAEVQVQASASEVTRRKYLNHESSIKTLGFLYLLAGILIVPGIGLSLGESVRAGASANIVMGQVLLLVIGLVDIAIGMGLQRLRKWASYTALTLGVLLALFNLFDLPGSAASLVIQVAIVLTLLSAKTRMVVSANYRRIIAETPHVKLRTSAIVWVLLGLFLAALVVIIYSAFTSR